jgi:hypothetical protein
MRLPQPPPTNREVNCWSVSECLKALRPVSRNCILLCLCCMAGLRFPSLDFLSYVNSTAFSSSVQEGELMVRICKQGDQKAEYAGPSVLLQPVRIQCFLCSPPHMHTCYSPLRLDTCCTWEHKLLGLRSKWEPA